MGKFRSTERKGFQITFENGLTVSVQWGAGNYCSNYYDRDYRAVIDKESTTAEAAVWSENCWVNAMDFLTGEFPTEYQGYAEVAGYLSADEIAELLISVKNYPADKVGDLEKFFKKDGV